MATDVRICFVGDSFVNGTGDETTLGWTGRLCAAANRIAPLTSYNLGVRRDTSADILRRWERECEIRLPAASDARMVLSCGVNDTMIEDGRLRVDLATSCANVRAILHGSRRYKVIMVGPPPLGEPGQDARIQRISLAFSREAGQLDIPYIELFSALSIDTAYRLDVVNNDGAHPQSAGYARIAELIGSSPDWWFHDSWSGS